MVSRNPARLTHQQREAALTYWKELRLRTRQANGLINARYCFVLRLDDGRATTRSAPLKTTTSPTR